MKNTVRHELLKPKAFCRESVAECIGYMIDTDENGSFEALVCFGFGKKKVEVAYEAVLLFGEGEPQRVTDRVTVEEMKDVGEVALMQILRIDSLPMAPAGGQMELVIRPYTVGKDGVRRYGDTVILGYDGTCDESGAPILVYTGE